MCRAVGRRDDVIDRCACSHGWIVIYPSYLTSSRQGGRGEEGAPPPHPCPRDRRGAVTVAVSDLLTESLSVASLNKYTPPAEIRPRTYVELNRDVAWQTGVRLM